MLLTLGFHSKPWPVCMVYCGLSMNVSVYLSVPASAAAAAVVAAPVGFGCPQKCHCHYVAFPPLAMESGSQCGCWHLACSACNCSTCFV